jgi:molybdopterin-guanine dinucleotide biosynthesis protein A
MFLSVVIQAGGQSRRMGQNKALLPFKGQPLIQRVVDRVQLVADELLLTTNAPESYQFLNLPMFADLLPGTGALGGLYTALSAASNPLVAVVACDMPFVSAGLLEYERDLCGADWDVVIPRLGSGWEPLHAIYRRETCLPKIRKALEENRLRMDSWFGEARIRSLLEEEIRRIDPDMRSFLNINTPEEFKQAEQLE